MLKKPRLFTLPKSRKSKVNTEGFHVHVVEQLSTSGLNLSQISGGSSGLASQDHASDNNDDTYSLVRTETNDTIDDNPGPGRIIDKYIYQRYGRKIERCIWRMSLSFLPSGVLAQRILEMQRTKFLCGADIAVGQAFELISIETDGRAVVDGLKCIAKQARYISVKFTALLERES